MHRRIHCRAAARVTAAAVLFLAVGTTSGRSWAQGSRVDKPLPARSERILQTADDWSIYISYYPAPGDKESITREAPVVILLHGDKDNRLVFEGSKGLAPQLQRAGYAVVAVDLRKHGQSTNVGRVAGDSPAGGKSSDGANLQAEDYQNMVDQDLEAVKKFIFEEHEAKHLNMNKMAVLGAETSAAVALCFAMVDWNKEPYDDAPSTELKTPRGHDVRALILISPPQRVKGLPVSDAISQVRNPDWNIGVLTIYGKRNKTDLKDAPAIHRKLAGSSKGNEDRMFLVSYDVKLRGIDLLGKKEVDAEPSILKFLALQFSQLKDAEWRDRQSRLTKR